MYTSAEIEEAFVAEAGDVATIAPVGSSLLWFNQAQARLLSYNSKTADMEWEAGDVSLQLPDDFVRFRRIEYSPTTDRCDKWRVEGQRFLWYVTRDRDFDLGAKAAGLMRLYFDASWPLVTEDDISLLSVAEDAACIYYVLHRFWRLLASNRSYYKRYATLVGANAVSMSDLQGEADRYLQDFTDARGEVVPGAPSYAYGS